jgi:hypothetical protein
MTVNPFETHPVPQSNGHHHSKPEPPVKQENFLNPSHILDKLGPWLTINAQQDITPNHQQGAPPRFNACECQKYPHGRIILLLHDPSLDLPALH